MGYYNGPNGNYCYLGVAYCFRNIGNWVPVDMAYRLWRSEPFLNFTTFLKTEWILVISVVQASRLRVGRFGVWIPTGVSYFLFSTTAKRGADVHSTQHPVSWSRCSFAEVKQPGVNLATHLCLMPRMEMDGAVLLFFLYVFISWTSDFTFAVRTNRHFLSLYRWAPVCWSVILCFVTATY